MGWGIVGMVRVFSWLDCFSFFGFFLCWGGEGECVGFCDRVVCQMIGVAGGSRNGGAGSVSELEGQGKKEKAILSSQNYGSSTCQTCKSWVTLSVVWGDLEEEGGPFLCHNNVVDITECNESVTTWLVELVEERTYVPCLGMMITFTRWILCNFTIWCIMSVLAVNWSLECVSWMERRECGIVVTLQAEVSWKGFLGICEIVSLWVGWIFELLSSNQRLRQGLRKRSLGFCV